MLTPVYPADFESLAFRLNSTVEFASGEVPTTVVVFDDDQTMNDFSTNYPLVTGWSAHVHYLALEKLLSAKDYELARNFVLERDHGGQLNGANSGCVQRTPGRVYQTLKKFYGVLHAPGFCKSFHVSDAESWPFRSYNFSDVISKSFVAARHEQVPQLLTSSWHNIASCKQHLVDPHTDASCARLLDRDLKFHRYWDEDGKSPEGLSDKLGHMMYDVNNWWMYDRATVQSMLRRVEVKMNITFTQALIGWRVACIALWTQHVQFFAASRKSTIQVKNFQDVLANAFPLEFERCCSCLSGAAPCSQLLDIFSPCFRSSASLENIGAFIVDRLGIFGLFGDEINSFPVELLQKEARLSWVINNAYRWSSDHSKYVIGT